MKKNMTAQIKLSGDQLKEFFKVAKPFMSTEEARYYLCGIYFEMDGSQLLGTATNGHILINQELESTPIEGEFTNFILSRADVDRLSKSFPKESDVILTQEDSGELMFDFFDFKYRCYPVNGTYPDWRTALPKERKMKSTGLKAKYLKAALTALKDKPVNIEATADESCAQVFTSDEAEGMLCVVMPMKSGQ